MTILEPSPQLSASEAAPTLPLFVSVDDHVVEPPDIWWDRLPTKYREAGPHVRRERGTFLGHTQAGRWTLDDSGEWTDVWYYGDVVKPVLRAIAAAGTNLKELDWQTAIFDELRPGSYQRDARLADMDVNHTEVSICFPNTIPRFCGQTFAEQPDKELSLLCVQAYNDWMIDHWCAGPARGRLVPLTIVPLWDPKLAAEEIHRCAAKGSHAVTFSENTHALGFASIHSGEWDVFFEACEATETTMCIHIGSSSKLPVTAPDAPYMISSILLSSNPAGSVLDLIFSGVLHRFPRLKVAYSEADVGWMPYLLEHMDKKWSKRGRGTDLGGDLPRLPSSYLWGRVYWCVIDDEVGLQMRDKVRNQICFETDYPHADSSWPDSVQIAQNAIAAGHLDVAETYSFLRGNAIGLFGLERFGITS